MKVSRLKHELKSLGLSTTGNKSVLQKRLKTYLLDSTEQQKKSATTEKSDKEIETSEHTEVSTTKSTKNTPAKLGHSKCPERFGKNSKKKNQVEKPGKTCRSN